MKMHAAVLGAVAWSVLAVSAVNAGGLEGRVVMHDNTPVVDAVVKAVDASGASFLGVTDESGEFNLGGLAAGSYDVIVDVAGVAYPGPTTASILDGPELVTLNLMLVDGVAAMVGVGEGVGGGAGAGAAAGAGLSSGAIAGIVVAAVVFAGVVANEVSDDNRNSNQVLSQILP